MDDEDDRLVRIVWLGACEAGGFSAVAGMQQARDFEFSRILLREQDGDRRGEIRRERKAVPGEVSRARWRADLQTR